MTTYTTTQVLAATGLTIDELSHLRHRHHLGTPKSHVHIRRDIFTGADLRTLHAAAVAIAQHRDDLAAAGIDPTSRIELAPDMIVYYADWWTVQLDRAADGWTLTREHVDGPDDQPVAGTKLDLLRTVARWVS